MQDSDLSDGLLSPSLMKRPDVYSQVIYFASFLIDSGTGNDFFFCLGLTGRTLDTAEGKTGSLHQTAEEVTESPTE